MKDAVRLRGRMVVEKFDDAGRLMGLSAGRNIFLTVGVAELWRLVCGVSANAFDESRTLIGIGDNGVTSVATMTDLQADTNKAYAPMDSGYPLVRDDGSVMFRASFGPSEANHRWSEFVVKHLDSGVCLDRGTGDFGIKAVGTNWVATVTLSIE